LRGGDVLVKFAEKEIRNIYDYTYALGERKPGDLVVLVVRREGKEVPLEITLASRPSASR
jgi:S1-C subfamily serine protease